MCYSVNNKRTKISDLYDITLCSSLKANPCFDGKSRCHLQGRRISQERNHLEEGSKHCPVCLQFQVGSSLGLFSETSANFPLYRVTPQKTSLHSQLSGGGEESRVSAAGLWGK
jgi:hypothetical protein